MSSENTKPKVGDKSVDATGIDLIARRPDAVRRMSKVHEGWEKAAQNLLRLTPEQIRLANLNAEDIARLPQLVADKIRIVELRPVTERLGEMLSDTDSVRGHEIAIILGEQAAQARRRADRSTERDVILGPLGDLLDYQYGPAIKAAETRAKNERGEGTPSPEPSTPPTSAAPSTPPAQATPAAQPSPATPAAQPAQAAPSAQPAQAAPSATSAPKSS